jgi:hypothetical protein
LLVTPCYQETKRRRFFVVIRFGFRPDFSNQASHKYGKAQRNIELFRCAGSGTTLETSGERP